MSLNGFDLYSIRLLVPVQAFPFESGESKTHSEVGEWGQEVAKGYVVRIGSVPAGTVILVVATASIVTIMLEKWPQDSSHSEPKQCVR